MPTTRCCGNTPFNVRGQFWFTVDALGHPVQDTTTQYGYDSHGDLAGVSSVSIGGVGNTLGCDSNGSITTYDVATGDDTYLEYDRQNTVRRIGANPG